MATRFRTIFALLPTVDGQFSIEYLARSSCFFMFCAFPTFEFNYALAQDLIPNESIQRLFDQQFNKAYPFAAGDQQE